MGFVLVFYCFNEDSVKKLQIFKAHYPENEI